MEQEKTKIAIVAAVSKALDYKNKNPNASDEEIFQHIMKEISATKKTKMAIIAAVNKALHYKNENIKDKEVLQRVMNELNLIIEKVE